MPRNDSSVAEYPRYGHHVLYNSLADVIDADRHLTLSDRVSVLDDLIDVIRAHKVQDLAGIRLLHRHCSIAADEIMVEQDRDEDRGPTLATRPEHFAGLNRPVTPNSYCFIEGQWQPVEYSDDPIVREAAEHLIERQEFLADFASTLERRGVSDTLGLLVAPRSFYEKAAPAGRPLLVESSYEESRENIVRYHASEDFEQNKLLQTVWLAADSMLAASCPTLCSMKCAIKMLCTEGNSGEHKQTVGHNSTHPKDHWTK